MGTAFKQPSTAPARGLRYEMLRGDVLRPLLPALGELVFAVFRGWPYLYGLWQRFRH